MDALWVGEVFRNQFAVDAFGYPFANNMRYFKMADEMPRDITVFRGLIVHNEALLAMISVVAYRSARLLHSPYMMVIGLSMRYENDL